MKFVLVNGYGWSGSSAVVDLLREYKNTYSPKKEFRLIKDPQGIADLDRAINDSIDPLNEDWAIREFTEFTDIYTDKLNFFSKVALAYNVEFGKNIKTITKQYINDLVSYTYRGYWWYLDINLNRFQVMWFKTLRKLHIYNRKLHTKMYLSLLSEEEFIIRTKKYLNDIFNDCANKDDTIVLDQAVPANRSDLGVRYFDNPKIIVVDRDPRDVYLDLIKEKSLVGYDIAINHDVDLFIRWFKKVRKENDKSLSTDVLRIRFEDLILNYDETIKKIEDYVGFTKEDHVDIKSNLKPEVSKKNIGLWKNYDYEDEIREIESKLGSYCYKG